MVVSGVARVAAIINPYGSLVALDLDPEGSRTILTGEVTLGTGKAPYTSMGDVLGWASLAGYFFYIVFQIVVEKRRKDQEWGEQKVG